MSLISSYVCRTLLLFVLYKNTYYVLKCHLVKQFLGLGGGGVGSCHSNISHIPECSQMCQAGVNVSKSNV